MSKTQLGCINASTRTSLQLVSAASILKVLDNTVLSHAHVADAHTVALIAEDARNSISVCHAFALKPKYDQPFLNALKEAGCGEVHLTPTAVSVEGMQMSGSDGGEGDAAPSTESVGVPVRRRLSKVDMHKEKQQARGVRTVAAAQLLGEVPVKAKSGDDVVRGAFKTLKGKRKAVQAAIVVADDALRYMYESRNEIVLINI